MGEFQLRTYNKVLKPDVNKKLFEQIKKHCKFKKNYNGNIFDIANSLNENIYNTQINIKNFALE